MDRRYKQPPSPRYYNYDDRDGYDSEEEYVDYDKTNPNFVQHGRAREEGDREGTREEEGRRKGKEKEKESMASWIGRVTSSSQAQFAATAIVSGAVVAGAILGYQAVRRQERVEELKSGIPELKEGWVFIGWLRRGMGWDGMGRSNECKE